MQLLEFETTKSSQNKKIIQIMTFLENNIQIKSKNSPKLSIIYIMKRNERDFEVTSQTFRQSRDDYHGEWEK